MKHSSAVTEIIILIAMMCAFVPLLSILIYQMNNSTYELMSDKTVMEEVSIEYVRRPITYKDDSGVEHTMYQWVPALSEPMAYSFGDVVLSYLIFDNYAPDSNIVCVDGMNSSEKAEKYVDMTNSTAFQNKYDLLGNWYKVNPGISICEDGHAHSGNDIFYINWIRTGNENDASDEGIACWSFDHDFKDWVWE